MNIELQRARSRQMFIFLLVLTAMVILMGRLYYWQVVRSPQLTKLADQEHIQNSVVPAPRGLIYDSQGQLLATNIVRDDVYIEPIPLANDYADLDTLTTEKATLIKSIRQVLPNLSVAQLNKDFSRNLYTVRIATSIDPVQSQQLRNLALPYIFLEPRSIRVYPGGDLASQVLGYVQENALPDGGAVGRYGIEGALNTLLSGKPGSFTAERDLNGNPLTVGASTSQQVVNGANVTLTIDSTVQYMLQTELATYVKSAQAQSGTAIVLDARSGAVVAMAGYPSFDPNHYSSYANKLGCNGTEDVFFNPALYCAYEPGSTMKAVTMAAGLDQGLITPETAIDDKGVLTFKDHTPPVTNWANIPYGRETMTQVLEHSANVGAAWVAHNVLGPNRFYPYLSRFGFGQATGIGGPEQSGFYRTTTDKNWSPSDLARQSFGQTILVTPIQMVMAYQAIANGGVMMKPYLVSSVSQNNQVKQTQPQVKQRVMSTQAAHQLTQMLIAAANYNQQATFPGYSVAVKTGTSTTQGLSDEKTEASMVGFVPASQPRFVILVKLDQPQSTTYSIFGGTAAGPLWRTLAQQLMWHFAITPDQA
ncbi:MAG TPA: penicillin-binding protein 2 [Ktedonobacteraceae bacterium]|jgi:cell division protein FtsI/penicillin-binding protein 2